MTFHVFILVWGDSFVRKFVEFSLPFHLMPGNIPALSGDHDVVYHIFTDRDSLPAFEPEVRKIEITAELRIHLLDEMIEGELPLMQAAAHLKSPEFKYHIQKSCIRETARQAMDDKDSALILLDSNFVLADGGMAALADKWAAGYRAVMVNVLRITEDAVSNKWWQRQESAGPRELFDASRRHLHHIHESYFVGSDNFTSYPSQVCWSVEADGIYARSFIPHPLMVAVRPAIMAYQSTADYDLVLRACLDEEIYLCPESDEILVCKYSADTHQAAREPGPPPTPENLALFILTSTHHRHRQFADTANRFRGYDDGGNWAAAEDQARHLIESSYAEVDKIIAHSAKLEANFLMYIKSYLGPIEDYMSPEMEPAELHRISNTGRAR